MGCYKRAVQTLSLFLALDFSSLIIPTTSTLLQVPLSTRSSQGPVYTYESASEAITYTKNLIISRGIRSTGSSFPFTSRRSSRRILNRLLRPTLISETGNSVGSDGSEAIVEFKPTTTTFINLTGAFLNLTIFKNSSLNSPVALLAGVTSVSSTGASPAEVMVNIGSMQPNIGQTTVAFNVLSFIQNITYGEPSTIVESASAQRNQGGTRVPSKVRLVFQIHRQCNEEDMQECPPTIDILTRVPFLVFSYGNNTDQLMNVDELLSAMARRQMS